MDNTLEYSVKGQARKVGEAAREKKVLVADLNAHRGFAQAILIKRLGFNVFLVRDSEDLLRLSAIMAPDLVVMDEHIAPLCTNECLEKLESSIGIGRERVIVLANESVSGKGPTTLLRPVSPTLLYSHMQRLLSVEQRQSLRLKAVFPVCIHSGKVGRLSFATALSEKGVFIRTLNPLPIGTGLSLTLDLAGLEGVSLKAEVIYIIDSTSNDAEPGMGVRFVNTTTYIAQRIRGVVEERLNCFIVEAVA